MLYIRLILLGGSKSFDFCGRFFGTPDTALPF
jgi:hypothetical protein